MRRLILLGLFLAIPAAGLVYWKRNGIAHRLKSYRAASHLENSIEAGEEENWNDAKRLAVAALQLQPGKIESVRQVFECEKALKSPSLIHTAQSLYDHPSATINDRAKVLQFYLDIGDVVRFKNQLARLPDEELQKPEALALGVRYSLFRGDPTRALALSQKLREARGNNEDRLLEATALSTFATSKPELAETAQDIIADLLSGDLNTALGALALLDTIPSNRIDLNRFSGVDEKLKLWEQEGKEIPVGSHLIATRLKVLSDPEKTEKYLNDIVDQFGESHPLELGNWFLENGWFNWIPRVVPEEKAMESSRHFSLLVQRDIREKDWTSARARLQDPHPGLPPAASYSLLATVEEALGHPANARNYWEQAFNQAKLSSGRSMLLKLANFAQKAGNKDICERALREALLRPSPVAIPTQDIAPLFIRLMEENDTRSLLSVSRQQLRSEPDNPTLRNNVIWLQLILEESAGRNLSKYAKDLVTRFPEIQTLKTTLALSYLEEGSPSEAWNTVQSISAEDESEGGLSESDRAVIALVLHQSGKQEEARSRITKIDWEKMLEEERDFFRSRLNLPDWEANPES